MCHFIETTAIAAHSFGMREAAIAAALVSLPGLANAVLASSQRAVAVAVNLAAVATAANDDLHPATCAHEKAACGRHRRIPSMPRRYRQSRRGVQYSMHTHAPCTRWGLTSV